jgi:probable HAF family extracellular repeat protein
MKTKFRILLSAITFTAGVALILAALGLPLRLAAQEKQNARLPHYAVTDLGTLGGTFGYAGAVNNEGWAAGAGTIPGDTAQNAILWRKQLKIQIGTFGGPNSAVFGKGLNESGQVVGPAETSDPDPLDQNFCGFGTGLICSPFIWQNGVMAQLPTLGGYNAIAYDINNRGVIAGQAQNTTLDPTCDGSIQEAKPVLWVNGQIQELPTIAGDTVGNAIEINDQGQAVGSTGQCPDFGTLHALLWANGTVTDLGNLGGTMNNTAVDINNRGQVVGSSDLAGDTTSHFFLWQNGVMTDLGTLPGDMASTGGGINDNGQIVGASCTTVEGICRATLWQNGVITDLNTLIRPRSGLFLVEAFDINARGQIVGIAFQRSSGEFHAFLATPCDEENGEGCDHSLVDGSAATSVAPAPSEASGHMPPSAALWRRNGRFHFPAFRPRNQP